MTEFENIGMCILIIIYGFVFYMAGRANLIDLVMLMIQDKIKELQDRIKDHDKEVK